jgi:hypothetical protein
MTSLERPQDRWYQSQVQLIKVKEVARVSGGTYLRSSHKVDTERKTQGGVDWQISEWQNSHVSGSLPPLPPVLLVS